MNQLSNDLIASLRDGRQHAYRQLYELYEEPLYALSYGILQNHADAQDAVQRTFIQVYRKLPSLKNDSSFHRWILTIANNEALMILRYRRPEEAYTDDLELIADVAQEKTMLPEKALEQRDTADRLRQMIARLPCEQRQVLALHYDQGLKIAEIAEMLGCSENTVKSRLRYARLRIKKEWEEYERDGQKTFGGVMLPFGEVWIRLLHEETKKKRRKAGWKRFKAFLRNADDPDYMIVAQAENACAVRIAAGVAAGFVAVMFAFAAVPAAAADSDEPVPLSYTAGHKEEREEETISGMTETQYIPPEDIAEQRIAYMPGGADASTVYDYTLEDMPAQEDDGLNNRREYVQTAPTEPSADPPEAPTEAPPQEAATEPPAQPATEAPDPPATEPEAPEETQPPVDKEQALSEMSGSYLMRNGGSSLLRIVGDTVSVGELSALNVPARRITSISAADGGYRFQSETFEDFMSEKTMYDAMYLPKGSSMAVMPENIKEYIANYGQQSFFIEDGVTLRDVLLLGMLYDGEISYGYYYRWK